MLFLTNVPLIMSGIRYREVAGFDISTGSTADTLGWFVFHSTPTMMGIGIFVMLMGMGLVGAHRTPTGMTAARRRFLVLGALGVVHGLLVWWGDILLYYAVAGLCVLPLLRLSQRMLVAVGVVLITFPVLVTLADAIAQIGGIPDDVLRGLERTSAGLMGQETTAARRYTSGDIGQVAAQRVADWWGYIQEFAPIGLLQVCGLLLIGTALARKGMFHPANANHPYWRVMAWRAGPAGLLLGVAGILVRTYDTSAASLLGALGSTAVLISSPLLALWWCAAVLRNGEWLTRSHPGRCLAAIGRYSLTTYLGCSVIATVAAYGLGLYGIVPLWMLQLLAVTAIVIAGELALPARDRNRVGPVEAVVRAFTTAERRSP
ncbi:DUF418 domain-containing protein (plasmid) [Streptomyces sp. HU2014]|uniref:DUF418 domain-containing protein n=1 Tax=Streptomyces sp. HU2014 TaxID=2939414 RepID=UPI00200EEB5E|nr:DUF418 domain-containing protein [Streptomyces sp. HU2014]UQI49738.1 DUF418 domain-containing protein [Streptomyces sp. HU2014]